jgi:hypothetical protein
MRVAAALPLLLLVTGAVTLAASLYLVVWERAESRVLTTLSVATCLGCAFLALLGCALRPQLPWTSSRASASAIGAWGIPLLMVAIVAPMTVAMTVLIPALIIDTAFGPALLFLVTGWGLAVTVAVMLVVYRRAEGPTRSLVGPVKVWHLGLVLSAAMAAFTYWLADWNPTLRHYRVEARATGVDGLAGVAVGDLCELDLGWFPGAFGDEKCRARLFCNGRKLFGGIGVAVFSCNVREQPTLVISGEDVAADDGDPAFSVDTATGQVRFSERSLWEGPPNLAAEILLEEAPR